MSFGSSQSLCPKLEPQVYAYMAAAQSICKGHYLIQEEILSPDRFVVLL